MQSESKRNDTRSSLCLFERVIYSVEVEKVGTKK